VDVLKRILIITLSLVLVLALAMSANAGVRNTVHDYQAQGRRTGAQSVVIPNSQRGMCSFCHIPHVAKGDRLWPTPGASKQSLVGLVGVLCAACHGTGDSNFNNKNSPGSEVAVDGVNRLNDIYATYLINHILIDDGVYANNTNQNYYSTANQFNQVNRWPYCSTQGTTTVSQKIECSSCHNPHSEDYGASTKTTEVDGDLRYGNDFLRAAMFNTTTGIAFCEYCHEEKNRNTATSGISALNTIGTGTHPVGTTADAGLEGQQDIHIESAERSGALRTNTIVSNVLYDMGIGTGMGGINPIRTDAGIGTHLTSYDTGGVTCQTCHKVHGAPRGVGNTWQRGATGNVGSYSGTTDRVYLAASDDGDANILAIENDSNGGTVNNQGSSNWLYPTGKMARTASDYNDLCIDCHETTPSVGKNWKTVDNNAIRTTADGDGTIVLDSHPVNLAADGVSESGFDLTVQDPNWNGKNGNWTNARWAGANGALGDDNFVAVGRFRGPGQGTATRSEIVCLTCHAIHDGEPGTPILRSRTKDFCSDCHTLSIGGVSHPVGYGSAMRDNPDAAVWPNGDNLPMSDYYTGGVATKSFKRSIDSITDMACFTCHAAHDGMDGFMLRVTDDNSRICTGCHTDLAVSGGTGGENPSNYIAEYNDNDDGLGDVSSSVGTSSVLTRLGSHYTGTVTSTDNVVGEARWAFTGSWTDTDNDGAGPVKAQTSHWTGAYLSTIARMQCQSCHTPHVAASGLVEANTYDGSTTPVDWDFPLAVAGNDINFDPSLSPNTTTKMAFTPTSALLLGNNVDSKMCATCHWPRGTHVTTIYSVPAKPDPNRAAGDLRRRRDYCTRIEKYIITMLNGEQEVQYNVYDLIATGSLYGSGANMDSVRTPESPCNFPPLKPGVAPGTAAADNAISGSKMLCDSCHAPHGAATRAGAFILEAGTGAASTIQLANQRIATRNYQALCWRCHDK
jgi:predicted CXXCH cytochrome family protein